MYRKKGHILNIEKCLIIADNIRIHNELEPIKSIKQLSVDLAEISDLNYQQIYSRIDRMKKGFYSWNDEFIQLMCTYLKVEENELVKEWKKGQSPF